jgi:hypothetical protein
MRRAQRLAAPGAGLWIMVDDGIGFLNPKSMAVQEMPGLIILTNLHETPLANATRYPGLLQRYTCVCEYA